MSLNHQLDEMYQSTKGWHVGKWRWLMIPIVILGMLAFILSMYSVEG